MIDDRRTGPEEALRIIDAMTATNERLRAELKDFDDAHAVTAVEWKATRSRLATATALIQEVWDNGDIPRKLGLRIKAFLAGQPAAPSWCEKCNSVRCEAERAVLDAMAEADEDYLEMSAEHHSGWKEKLALAELARRGLK